MKIAKKESIFFELIHFAFKLSFLQLVYSYFSASVLQYDGNKNINKEAA